MKNREELLDLSYTNKLDWIYNDQYLDIFIEDPSPYVRSCVAERGYGIETLINDKNIYVHFCVIAYCRNHKEKFKDILMLYNL